MHDIFNHIKEYGFSKKYNKGNIIFFDGDDANGFYFIKSGEVRVYKEDVNAKVVELGRLFEGDCFGEVILFLNEKFSVNAEAVSDSELIFFKKETVMQLIKKKPDLAVMFLNLLAKKCISLKKRIESLELRTVRQRLISFLIEKCPGNKQCMIELKLKKTQLAQRLGTISETLSRNLRQLQDDDLIKIDKNRIVIKDCNALKNELEC